LRIGYSGKGVEVVANGVVPLDSHSLCTAEGVRSDLVVEEHLVALGTRLLAIIVCYLDPKSELECRAEGVGGEDVSVCRVDGPQPVVAGAVVGEISESELACAVLWVR
jgi:hypothetical protein